MKSNRKIKVCAMVILFFAFFSFCGRGKTVLAQTAESLTEEEIYTQMTEHFLKREPEFEIITAYNECVSSIETRLNSEEDDVFYSVFFDMAEAVDDPETTDDSDYLYGNIKSAYCQYWDGTLYFYDVEYYETQSQTKKVNTTVKKLAKKIMKKKKSVYNRIRLAHDTVVDMVKYDNRKVCYYSAYGGLCKGKTVCNGYALIMYKLLNEMGIPCKFITGWTYGKGSLHAWNIVKIKGRWYNLDATFDDEDDGRHHRDYFLKTDKSISEDHTKDFFYLTDEFMELYPMAKSNYKKK